MSKKVNFPSKILEAYSDYILEKGSRPANMHQFAQSLKTNEAEIYKHFSSFEAIEEHYFVHFFEQTLELLQKDETYNESDAQGQFLAFYYTYFELLTMNRSLVLHLLPQKAESFKTLKPLRSVFKVYVKALELSSKKIEFPKQLEQFANIQNKSTEEAAWIHLLSVLKFWMDDRSPSFEKTDIYIEKSLSAGFELINTSPIQKFIDLGKFLWKEKMI